MGGTVTWRAVASTATTTWDDNGCDSPTASSDGFLTCDNGYSVTPTETKENSVIYNNINKIFNKKKLLKMNSTYKIPHVKKQMNFNIRNSI